jgi:hypothetical protein
MHSATGVTYGGAELAWLRGNSRYRLAVQAARNPLYEAKNDLRFTFGIELALGRTARPSLGVNEEQAEQEESSAAPGYAIAAGAAAVALIISSGGDGDSAERNSQQHAAARSALNKINPTSVKENREYGGYVYRNPDGSYSATDPLRGKPASLELPPPASAAPAGATTTASYHTHAAFDPRYDNENFSLQDLATDIRFNLDGYLGTPMGQFKWHDVSAKRVVTLGTIAN